MHNYKELKVWKLSMTLVTSVYTITADFPNEEKFALVSQLRRSAVSFSSNIAEGSGRRTDKEFAHFLSISYGSQFELETQLLISSRVGFLSEKNAEKLFSDLSEIQKMTRSLIEKFS
jgi:four helix bundle protein